jgi:dTDP-4-amino-4,6-dideoxygalactose transaminase
LQLEGVDRDKVINYLTEKGIPAMLYYPVPSHKQNMFKALGGSDFTLPVTDVLQEKVLSLPIHTELTNEELEFITTNFLAAVEAARI